jgi:hypothetical protein
MYSASHLWSSSDDRYANDVDGRPSGRRLRGDDGSAMAEAAFMSPLIFFIILTVFEMSLLMQSLVTTSSAVATGIRKTSVLGAQIDADYQLIQAIKKDMEVASLGTVKVIVVFDAGLASPSNPTLATAPTVCSQPGAVNPSATTNTGAKCNAYTPTADFNQTNSKLYACADSGTGYGTRSNGFCPTKRKTAVAGSNGPPDYVGVYIRMEHNYFSGFFGDKNIIEQTMITRLEPQALA